MDEIYRLSSLVGPPTAGTTIARVTGSFSATAVHDAYRDGGDAFYETMFAGNDFVDLNGPPVLGALDASPLIETFGGSDTVLGTIYADHIDLGSGNDEIHGEGGNDILEAGTGADEVFGGNGHEPSTPAAATTS